LFFDFLVEIIFLMFIIKRFNGKGNGEYYTNSISLANFVDSVVGFLNVLVIRLRSLLLAAALSFEIEMVLVSLWMY
jgi:hypothetical protein